MTDYYEPLAKLLGIENSPYNYSEILDTARKRLVELKEQRDRARRQRNALTESLRLERDRTDSMAYFMEPQRLSRPETRKQTLDRIKAAIEAERPNQGATRTVWRS